MTSATNMVTLLVPCFNSAATLGTLIDRIERVFSTLPYTFEVVLVDDGSEDETWSVLRSLKEKKPIRMTIIRLLHNVGQHSAILCALRFARGEIIVTMDDDLQHPPEEIPKLVAAIEQGWDVAIGAYDTKRHSGLRNWAGAVIDHLIKKIFALPKDFSLTSFRAFRRSVGELLMASNTPYPYLTAMILANARRVTNVPVRHEPRLAGTSNYSFRRALGLALNLVLHYSEIPILIVAAICTFALIAFSALGIWVLIRTLLMGASVPGWASLMVLLSLSTGLTQFSLIVCVVYLARIQNQLQRFQRVFPIGEVHG